MTGKYETVIGLEVHVELATKTKIFCGCRTDFGGKPNSQTCPVCSGMPGSLPVLNKKVLEYAIAVGIALNCDITRYSKFDRKNYFYPDNPQNYQISQLYQPICRNGNVEIKDEKGNAKKIGIHEIHMEEDAGKLIHDDSNGLTYVDYNRAGVPLIEIVSEPDMRSADEVIDYLEKLRMTIQYLKASDCKLNEGSMRADVNISVHEWGNEFGTRTEMKNLNSFKAIRRAIEGETKRQISLIENGEKIIQETRRWDDAKGESYSMRSKEDARDYRYFPEPDLPPIFVSDQWISEIKGAQPEFKNEKMERYVRKYNLPKYDADIITSTKKLADIFEETIKFDVSPKKASNYIMGEVMRLIKVHDMDPEDINFSPENLAKLIKLTDKSVINISVAKEIFEKIFVNDIDPEKYVEENGLKQSNNEAEVKEIVIKVIENNPQSVSDFRNGKQKAMGYLVGQAMKESKGRANPTIINKLLRELL